MEDNVISIRQNMSIILVLVTLTKATVLTSIIQTRYEPYTHSSRVLNTHIPLYLNQISVQTSQTSKLCLPIY